MPKKNIEISAEEFDRRFDAGEDMTPYLDMSTARRPGIEPKRINVDFPFWMVEALDREAAKMGITRQSLIKVVVHEHLQAKMSA
jgi:predicted DNA binding CopG/RHH family protein